VLSIPELVRVGVLIDDQHRWELADRAAALWSRPNAVFRRSSTAHVFVTAPCVEGGGDRLVLRMAPAHTFQGRLVARSTSVCEALYRAGVAVPRPVRSSAGSLVEELDGIVVTAQQLIEGRLYDVEEVDADLAHRWGRALAIFHARASVVDISAAPRRSTPPPPDLAQVTADIHRGLAGIRRSPDAYGVVHGDPESDNVVFGSDGITFIDLDEVDMGWFAADIAFALRAWAAAAASPDLSQTVPAAFVAGYCELRPLPNESLDSLELFARAQALDTLLGLRATLADREDPTWPTWAVALRRRLSDLAITLERALNDG